MKMSSYYEISNETNEYHDLMERTDVAKIPETVFHLRTIERIFCEELPEYVSEEQLRGATQIYIDSIEDDEVKETIQRSFELVILLMKANAPNQKNASLQMEQKTFQGGYENDTKEHLFTYGDYDQF